MHYSAPSCTKTYDRQYIESGDSNVDARPGTRMQQMYSARRSNRVVTELTSEDEGKRVVAANDRELGRVDGVEEGTVYVALNNGIEVNWGETDKGTYVLGADTIDSVGEDEVRLRGNF